MGRGRVLGTPHAVQGPGTVLAHCQGTPGTGPTEPGAGDEGRPSEARLGPDELSRVRDPHSPGGLRNQATAQRTELYHARWPWHSSPWASRWQPGQSLGRPGACPHLRPGGGQTRVSGTVTQASAVGVRLAHAPGVDCGLPPGPGSWQGSPDAHGQQWPAPVLVFGPKVGRAHRHFMPPPVSSARGHWLWALSRAGGRAPGPAWRSAQRPDSGSAVGILRARAESPPHTWPVWAPRASSILSPRAWPRLPTQSPDALPQLLGPCHVPVTCQASGSARAARLPRPRDAWGSSRPALGSPAVGRGGAPGV